MLRYWLSWISLGEICEMFGFMFKTWGQKPSRLASRIGRQPSSALEVDSHQSSRSALRVIFYVSNLTVFIVYKIGFSTHVIVLLVYNAITKSDIFCEFFGNSLVISALNICLYSENFNEIKFVENFHLGYYNAIRASNLPSYWV